MPRDVQTDSALSYGDQALSRVEPYVPEMAHRHEMPGEIGRLISAWDDPKWVGAEAASHMRNDDYVLGLVYQGIARAYPIWVIDHYHVINDVVGMDPIVVASCDACQSGGAFLASLDGARVKFAVSEIYNATFLMVDRTGMFEGNGSRWLHYEGVAISGRYRGTFLSYIPTFHTIWKDWRAAHPETEVMLAPLDRYHRDARHGHGRGEYFSRPGVSPAFVQTITGGLDGHYPEHEMVLGINTDQAVKAYPLREVKKSGGVVHDTLGGHPIVVIAGPRPEQCTMAAYSCVVGDRVLSFGVRDGQLIDQETDTRWTIEGQAIQGLLAGRRLLPLRWSYLRWHVWVYWHRRTELYQHRGALPAYPAPIPELDLSPFEPVLRGLSKLGRPIGVEGAIVTLQLPHEAEQGICLYVGGDRLNLYRFKTQAAAEDYAALEGVWCCVPDGSEQVGRRLSRRAGLFVLESDPDIQYADPAQIVRLPDSQIRWSEAVTDEELVRVWSANIPEHPDQDALSFSGLVEHLKRWRYDVVEVAFLPPVQLRVGTTSVVAATISGDRMAIYKCLDDDSAARVGAELSHAFRVGRWVVRSIPETMYRDPRQEIWQLPDEEVRWSSLLENERFLNALRDYAAGPAREAHAN